MRSTALYPLTIAFCIGSIGFTSAPTPAESPQQKGYKIATEVVKRDEGYRGLKARAKMILYSANGKTSVKKLNVKMLEVHADGDKIKFQFEYPGDIKNTTLLVHSKIKADDKQWLYLPTLGRVKRIISSNRSGAFVGSEFAYEDMTSQEVERYSYNYLRDNKVAGRSVFVVERFPTYRNSGYKRQIVYIDKKLYIPLKIEYFNRANQHSKTLIFSKYKKYRGRHWRALKMKMFNHLTKKSTVIDWNNYDFNAQLKESNFAINNIEKY